jgi:regulation of enolase protein 1 (concanavalin A-like superfamily)
VSEPIATATALPLSTATAIPPTVVPTPTLDPNFFRDDFTGTLATGWTWVRENPQQWSLNIVPDSLQINAGSGYVVARSNSNLLLRPAPAGNFQIETQVKFRPTRNFQFAGLIIYASDLDFIQAGRGYCQASDCVGQGLYMDYYEKGVVVKPSYAQAYTNIDPLVLRLSRRGTAYTFEGSTNGLVWFVIGNHTSAMDPVGIGLVTGQRTVGSAHPAVFDYFEVRSLP